MAIVRELVTLLRYQVDQSGLRQYAQQAQAVGKQVSGVGRAAMAGWKRGTREALAAYGLVPGQILRGIREQRRLNREQRRSAQNVREIGGGYSAIGGYVRAALAALGTFQSARMVDEWAGVEARVGLVTDGINEQRRALERLYGMSQASGQDYLSTGDLFTAVQRNRKELGLQLDQSLQLTDTIGKLLTIGGGSATGQQAALIQLSQALGSGVLRGEELNSILEQAPRLAQAIAEGFGVSVGQLRTLGQEGRLTSKELAEGLLKQAENLNEEFERMPKTFGRGITMMRNSYGRFINELNKASRASERFYAVSELIANNMATIVKIGAFTALSAALTKLRPIALGALAPFLRMAALLAGIYLIGEDLFVWAQGGQSLFGRWFGEYSEWQGTVDAVKQFLTYIKDTLGGSNQELSAFLMKWGAVLLVGFALLRIMIGIGRVVGVVGKGLWALLLPIRAIMATSLGRFLGLFAVAAMALKWIYDNSDRIAAKIESAFGLAFDRLKQRLEDMVPDWIKWAMKNVTGGGAGAEWSDGLRDSILGPLNEKAGRGMGTPQSFRGGESTINQDITITAPSNNPAALARVAGDEVGRRTEAVVRSGWKVPNVEALA